MKKVVRLTESDLARIVKRVINEQDKLPASVNKLEKAIQMSKAPEGRNNPDWKNLVLKLKNLSYPPRILTFDSYGTPPIPSQSMNWGTTKGPKGNYGFAIASTDHTAPKETMELFNTNDKKNEIEMHNWWKNKGYIINRDEISINFKDADKLRNDIEEFFTKYPPVRVK